MFLLCNLCFVRFLRMTGCLLGATCIILLHVVGVPLLLHPILPRNYDPVICQKFEPQTLKRIDLWIYVYVICLYISIHTYLMYKYVYIYNIPFFLNIFSRMGISYISVVSFSCKVFSSRRLQIKVSF